MKIKSKWRDFVSLNNRLRRKRIFLNQNRFLTHFFNIDSILVNIIPFNKLIHSPSYWSYSKNRWRSKSFDDKWFSLRSKHLKKNQREKVNRFTNNFSFFTWQENLYNFPINAREFPFWCSLSPIQKRERADSSSCWTVFSLLPFQSLYNRHSRDRPVRFDWEKQNDEI